MKSDLWRLGQKVDLENCSLEPIHIPGSIQPHGVLLAIQPGTLEIQHFSDNLSEWLGWSGDQVLGQSLEGLWPPGNSHREKVLQILKNFKDAHEFKTAELADLNPLKFAFNVQGEIRNFDGVIHRSGELLILELEPAADETEVSFVSLHQRIARSIRTLGDSHSLSELCRGAAQEVRELTGYDRVMVYQFDEHWNGRVVAEARSVDMDSFDGLYFPASDIPKQARELYTRSWLRVIADVSYRPVPVLPTLRPSTLEPLDLSHAGLRSVSPIHIEYLKNMNVGASMSISILREGVLWGLIACHHRVARPVPFETRLGCEFVGRFMSSQIVGREKGEDREIVAKLRALQPIFLERMNDHVESGFLESLITGTPDIRELANAAGAAVLYHDECERIGVCPTEKEIRALARWLSLRDRHEFFVTDSLARQYPAAADFKDVASGVIALSVPEPGDQYVFWFKPEVIQTVNWSGDPKKPVEKIDPHTMRVHPRKSFELWKESVRLKSLPWKTAEIEAVENLRRSIVDVDLNRQVLRERAARAEAERSNLELDEFAYVVSHDLKEPLRGIKNYSEFLIEDAMDKLSAEECANVKEIHLLALRTQELLTSLHYHSKIGRVKLSFAKVDLNTVVVRALELLGPRIREVGADISIPRPLPTIECDTIRVGEIFNNLVSNALKYNEQARKYVEIGFDESQVPTAFYVRDNGIGIPERHLETVFGIFKRLHGNDEYGGGSGSGLAIVKRIVERHKGKTWVKSQLGQGATFWFTLAPSAGNS